MSIANYNLNDLYLKAAAWFVGHKDFFKKWWVIMIISLDLLMLVYVAVSFLLYAFETPRYNQMISQLGNNFINQVYQQENQPKDLTVEYAKVLVNQPGRYDLVAKVKNPNRQWGVKNLFYAFKIKGEETKQNLGYLGPNEEKYFLLLNYNTKEDISLEAVEFVSQAIEWQKLGDESLLQRIAFAVSEEKLSQGELTNTAVQSTLVTAKIKNNSLYDFWKVGVNVVVLVDSEPLAVNYYILREFKSSTEKEIIVSWLKKFPLTATLEIKPEVNIFDADNFMTL